MVSLNSFFNFSVSLKYICISVVLLSNCFSLLSAIDSVNIYLSMSFSNGINLSQGLSMCIYAASFNKLCTPLGFVLNPKNSPAALTALPPISSSGDNDTPELFSVNSCNQIGKVFSFKGVPTKFCKPSKSSPPLYMGSPIKSVPLKASKAV